MSELHVAERCGMEVGLAALKIRFESVLERVEPSFHAKGQPMSPVFSVMNRQQLLSTIREVTALIGTAESMLKLKTVNPVPVSTTKVKPTQLLTTQVSNLDEIVIKIKFLIESIESSLNSRQLSALKPRMIPVLVPLSDDEELLYPMSCPFPNVQTSGITFPRPMSPSFSVPRHFPGVPERYD